MKQNENINIDNIDILATLKHNFKFYLDNKHSMGYRKNIELLEIIIKEAIKEYDKI